MKVAELRAILARQGVPVIGYREGNDDGGGLIQVTDTIHVELSKEGQGAVVVKMLNEEEFHFYARRTRVRDLIFDLVKAGAVVLH